MKMILKFCFLFFFIGSITAIDDRVSGCKSPRLQHGENGTFSSINYPNDYVSYANCEWLISVPDTKIIKITFNNRSFRLEHGIKDGKCIDSVEVFEGQNSSGKRIGEYCQSAPNGPILINNSYAFVTFKSDRALQYSGFSIHWSAVDKISVKSTDNFFQWNGKQYYHGKVDKTWQEARQICRGIWPQGNGDLVTINNQDENNYLFRLVEKNNRHMTWIGANDINSEGRFVWPDGSSLHFSHWDFGEPNGRFDDEDCVHFLNNAGGRWNDKSCSAQFWFFCEQKKDKINNGSGTSGCGSPRLQSGEQGTFSSMNYPNNYLQSSRCEWLISVPASKTIKLTFNDTFELESSCYDRIEVFKGSNSNSELIDKYCGNNRPQPIFVKGNQVFVTFNSDNSMQYKGFSIQWIAVQDVSGSGTSGCGSPRWQSGEQGTFSSLNYPNNYLKSSRCEWLISVPASKTIKLTFNNTFELESCHDRIEVFEGSNSNGELIGKYCGNIPPQPIFVKSNQVFVTFNSDNSRQYKGFSIQWNAVQELTTESTDGMNMLTWKGNQYYLGKNESTWHEARDVCRKIWGQGNGDLVTINNAEENEYLYNAARRNSRYMAWIGANDIMSEGNFVWADNGPLKYSSWLVREPNDKNNEDCAHFLGSSEGKWNDKQCCSKMWFICERRNSSHTNVIEDSLCNSPRLQTGVNGSFSSINFPNLYNNSAICTWVITVPTSKVIKLRFDKNFGLEKGFWNGKCVDSVEVFEGSNSRGEKIGTYCGKVAPSQIVSESNQAYVTFKSDRSNQYKGFRIEWIAVPKVPNILAGDPNIFKWNGGEYYRSNILSTWHEAREICREIWGEGNGDLVKINNAEENNYVYKITKQFASWIGANDINEEGKFVWTDNSPVQFSNWMTGEPNNQNNENCAQFREYSSAKWNDMPCCAKMHFICEHKTIDS